MKILARELGANIRAKRKDMGISQDDLALDCGVDRSYMGRIERGEVNITLKKLYSIAWALSCETAALLPPVAVIKSQD
ncbi:MAG: helix-turn-helix transcriptional regulator [Zhongshania sp.]|uniref:helix-turn-helix domain-containing protein n=1 Tax=Zhongshania sp. TaxID=1971902 RepID=UPI0026250699|nr:helix-turn-helix transcriptional regulator [Zhongshania sp.]MDF1692264.1 helix-turn-helix transcriptional regulator [Zhongshania sp.]